MQNPWKILAQKPVYDNPWIHLVHYDVINPAGGNGIYGIVHFKNLAIGIVAIDEHDQVQLVRQHRFPLGVQTIEIPEGGCPAHEDPLLAAKRELLEETGIQAANWQEILTMHLSNSVTDEKAIIYLATNLTRHEAAPEDTEDIIAYSLPFDTVFKQVMDGDITDAITVAAILKLGAQRLVAK